MIGLDTHILIHALRGDLRPRERTLLSGDTWGIAAIVLWELAKLSQLGRVTLDLADRDVEDALSGIHVWPLDLDVARTSTQLDFRGDPADELIAATSIVHRVPLLTRDKSIRRSKIVPLAR
jgi:PIN domain nuclease of toxin-antitoxin system